MKDKNNKQNTFIQTNELPMISVSIQKGTGDFVTEIVNISVSGYTSVDCRNSLDYTINNLKKIDGNDRDSMKK